VNAQLASAIQTVAAVRVEARRPRPARSLGADGRGVVGTDGLNRQVDGVVNALPPELQGNIDAMAALVPGLAITPGGVSAFGMGSDANMTTLNGMPFAAGAVPRDLQTTTAFLSSPWDPTRGGFSGVLQSATVASGGNITRRTGRVTLDAPALQVGDPIAARFGQKYTNLQLGGASSGAFSLDRYFYNVGYQGSRQMADVASLIELDADALLHAGIAPDSAARLMQILAAQRVPLTLRGVPDQRTTTSASLLARFDKSLPTPPAGAVPPPAWNVMVGANYSETGGGALPTAFPATTGKRSNGGAMIQGFYSRFFGAFGDYINETSSNLTFSENRGTPYLSLPSGAVLIASSIDGAAPTIGSLSFGGNSGLAQDAKTVAWQVDNQTNFLLRHQTAIPMKVFFQSRYEHYDQSLGANRAGAFNFASLSDLAANRPSSFTRTLNTPNRAGGEWLGAGALGGSWSKPKIILSGGARVDANVFLGTPAYNAALDRAFGIRNDRAPNSVAVSPRLGFNWYYTAQNGLNASGTQISSLFRGGPQIRGGIGEFRSFAPSTLLADAIGTTGLPGSTQRLVCTGPASPIPDWQAFTASLAAIPTTCAGGAAVFADTAANVALVDPSYTPPRAWRATLGWTNTMKGNYIAVDGVYSLNLNQQGAVDVNFAGAQRFTLANELNRPVFVSPGSIVASTGSVSAVESRRSAAFGRVTDRVSDLRGDTRQITVYAIPNIPFRFGIYTFGYTYADARTQARGFDQSTAADPRSIEWASAAFTPRHQVSVQGGRVFFGGKMGLTMFGRVMSGFRYAPTVSGDVNGDGSFNDRAFVFDPSKVGVDTNVARGLRDILANGSSSARSCLLRQLGTIAGRNSCVGPWSATMNASIVIPNIPKTNNNVSASLNLANPLGGLDQLLHGSDKLRGWGAIPFIDGTLYQVRGFDPQARSFSYQVNPRFGNTNPSVTTFRTPFRITLDVRVNYGRSPQEQALELNLRIKPPLVGTRASADTLKARYMGTIGTGGFSDIYRIMLRYADSLALTREQTEKVQARQKILISKADSIYTELAQYLFALAPNYDAREAAKRARDTGNNMWTVIYAETPFLKELLTPGQIRLLPSNLRDMVTVPNYRVQFYMSF
jgi:hypothetical protein